MSKVDVDSMEGKELSLLAIARKLRHAKKIEEVLNSYGVDYCVELGEYTDMLSVIFGSSRTGAFFYVRSDSLPYCQELLRQNRLGTYIVSEDI